MSQQSPYSQGPLITAPTPMPEYDSLFPENSKSPREHELTLSSTESQQQQDPLHSDLPGTRCAISLKSNKDASTICTSDDSVFSSSKMDQPTFSTTRHMGHQSTVEYNRSSNYLPASLTCPNNLPQFSLQEERDSFHNNVLHSNIERAFPAPDGLRAIENLELSNASIRSFPNSAANVTSTFTGSFSNSAGNMISTSHGSFSDSTGNMISTSVGSYSSNAGNLISASYGTYSSSTGSMTSTSHGSYSSSTSNTTITPVGSCSSNVGHTPNAKTVAPPSDNFLSGPHSGLNHFGFRNEDTSTTRRKPFSELPGTDEGCHEDVPQLEFENNHVLNHIFGDNEDSSYPNESQELAYFSRIDENGLEFERTQPHMLISREEFVPASSGSALTNGYCGSSIFSSSNEYRSFSSELNSPNLHLPEDRVIDFEFPLHLGLEEMGFDNFMLNEQNGGAENGSRMWNKNYGGSGNTGIKYISDLATTSKNISGSTDNNECGVGNFPNPKLEVANLEINNVYSESYSSRMHSNTQCEHDSFKTDRETCGYQFTSQHTPTATATPLHAGVASQSAQNSQNPWLEGHFRSEDAGTGNHDFPTSDISGGISYQDRFENFLNYRNIGNTNSGNIHYRNHNSDNESFINHCGRIKDFKINQFSGTPEARRDSFLTDFRSYSENGDTGCVGIAKWQSCDSAEEVTRGRRSWIGWENKGGPGYDVSYAAGVGRDGCTSNRSGGGRSLLEMPPAKAFIQFHGNGFRDSLPFGHDDISSTTAATTANSENSMDSDSYSFSTANSNLSATHRQQHFRKLASSESGRRALAKVVQERGSRTECLDSGLVSSAMDYIMKNRPKNSGALTAREILTCSLRHLKATRRISGDIIEALDEHCDEFEGGTGDNHHRKKMTKLSPDSVTTTRCSPSPSAPSSSLSPSASLPTVELRSVTSLVACITPLSSSTNENGGSSNVSSSSKADKRRPSILPPCRVCCSKASGLHYGVVTCEACNGFFRRSLKRGAIYLCSKNKNCEVNGKKRGECSHCRYHKCLSVGMSKSAVKTGRYSDKTRLAYAIETEAQNKTNMLSKEHDEVKDDSCGLFNIHNLGVNRSACDTDLELLGKHYEQSSSETSSVDNEAKGMPLYSSVLPEVPTTTFPEYLSERGLSKLRSIILEQYLQQYLRFARSLPGFNLLAVSDQTKLVRAAWHGLWLLETYRDLSSELKVPVSSHGLHHEIGAIFGKDFTDLSFRLSARLEKVKVTPDELMYVQMLCLTDPQTCGLDSPAQVTCLHWLISQCLVQELQRTHPDDERATFSEIQSLLSDLKVICRNTALLGNEYIQHCDTPLLQEMLTSSPR